MTGDARTRRRQIVVAIATVVLAFNTQANAHPGEHDDNLPDNVVKIYVDGEYRFIESNGVPDHPEGHTNPGKVEEQEYKFRVPLKPKAAEAAKPLRHSPFGVAINGVVFDPSTNEFWNNDRRWMYDALSGKIELGMDANHAHVQPGGKYHYHGQPTALLKRLGADKKMALVGYAADGFPIYGPMVYTNANDPKSPLKKVKPSYKLKKGTRPAGEDGPGGKWDGLFFVDWEYVKGSGDLDDCNGRTGVTPEYPEGTYYYVLTDTFPFVPRQWKGTPDESFLRHPGGEQGGRPGPGGPPPRGGPPPMDGPPR